MSCRDVVDAMTDAEEGALKGWRWFTYKVHLGICPSCKAHKRQFDATVDAVKVIGHDKPPESSRAKALAEFRKNKESL